MSSRQPGPRRGPGRCRTTSRHFLTSPRPIAERLEGRRLLSARLIGITGNQRDPGLPGDETLFDVNVTTGAIAQIVRLPYVPDTDAIGYNPETGLLHRTSGAESYDDDTPDPGYRDNQFMQTVDLRTSPVTQVGIFNANYPGTARYGTHGINAPRPTWVLPTTPRTDQQNDASGRIRGPDEYHALRDLTWYSSERERLFIGTDEHGIFKLTADGLTSTFVTGPFGLEGPKGIALFTLEGERRLLVTERDGPTLFVLDPGSGSPYGTVTMVDETTRQPIPGVLSLVEHPDGVTLLGIAKPPGAPNDPTARELVRIDPVTGYVNTIGRLGVNMADLAFVADAPPQVFGQRPFYNNSESDGNTPGASPRDDDAVDYTKSGGLPGGAPAPSNVTAYGKGLNGVMVDFFPLPAGTTSLSAGDFTIRSTSAAAPNAWAAGPAPLSVSIRRGAGPGGADRVSLIWNDYSANGSPANEAVGLGWLEVTVRANANTGLAAPVTFVLGNLPGDLNGDRRVDGTDFSVLASNFGKQNMTPARGDLTSDDRVDAGDFAILAAHFGKTLAPPPVAFQAVARQSAAPAARRVVAAQPPRAKRSARVLARGPRGLAD